MSAPMKPAVAANVPLPPEARDEIRRVFSIFDADGSHTLDPGELRHLLGVVAPEAPVSDGEVGELLEQIDANRDGLVSLAEFEKTVGAWVVEARRYAKRRFGGESVTAAGRKRLHLDISGFFRQFRPTEDMEKRLREESAAPQDTPSTSGRGSPTMGWVDYDSGEDPYAPPPFPTGKKLGLLSYTTSTLASYGNLVVAVRSDNPEECLEGVCAVEQMLSLTLQFASPAQRYLIAQPLIQLFEVLTHAEVPQRLVYIVGESTAPLALKAASLRALALYTPGPRIAHTPVDNVWHPERALPKQVVVQAGILQHVVTVVLAYREGVLQCNGSAETDLLALCLRLCGVLMEFNGDILDLVNHLGLRRLLLEICVPEAPLYVLRPASYALAVLCGHTHDPSSGGKLGGLEDSDFDALQTSLETVLRATRDLEVYSNVCTALAYAMPYLQPGADFGGVLLEHWSSLLGLSPTEVELRHRGSSAEEAAVNATQAAIASGADVATAARLAARAAVEVQEHNTHGHSPLTTRRASSRVASRLSPTRMHAVVCVATCLQIHVRLEGLAVLSDDGERGDLFGKLLEILAELLQSRERLLKILALGIIDALTGTQERPHSLAEAVINSPQGTAKKAPRQHNLQLSDVLLGGSGQPLLPLLLKITEKDQDAMGCRTVATVKQFSLTAAAVPEALRDLDVVPILFRSLSNFRRHDDVLADVYHYLGPSFNFKLVEGCLMALETILLGGEQIRRAQGTAGNPFLDAYAMDAVESLRTLIAGVLRASKSGRLEAWRLSNLSQEGASSNYDGSEATLEQSIESLANAVRSAHEANTSDPSPRGEFSRQIMRQIDDMMTDAATGRQEIVASSSPSPPPPPPTLRPFSHPIPPPPPPTTSLRPTVDFGFGYQKEQGPLPNPWLPRPGPNVGPIRSEARDPAVLALTLTPLNFDGRVETVIPRTVNLADLVRYASVQAGRSVQLAYRDGGAGYIALDSPAALEDGIAQAIRAHPHDPRPPLELFVLAQFTDQFAQEAQDSALPSAASTTAGPTFASPTESTLDGMGVGQSAFPPFHPLGLSQEQGSSPFAFHYTKPTPPAQRLSRRSGEANATPDQKKPSLHIDTAATGSAQSPGSFAFAPNSSEAHTTPPAPRASDAHRPAASFSDAATTGMTAYQKQLLKMCQLMKDRYRIDFSCFEVDRVWRIFKHYNTRYLDQSTFSEALVKEGVTDRNAALQAFAAFDINGDGKISVNEFICCLSVMRRGNLSKKLRYAFKAFDINNDGFIDTEELAVLVAATTGLNAEASQQKAADILRRCDGNKDGRLSFEEFCFGVKHSVLLLNSFWTSHLHTPREGSGPKARRVA